MSIFENLFYLILLLLIGSLVVKVGLKLRYLAPLCFLGVFILVWLFVSMDYSSNGEEIRFFINGKFTPNTQAIDILFMASAMASVATFLLVVVVWSIRNDVFF